MPQLAEHQLKVAAVGDLICGHFNCSVDRDNIVAACLLHDIGNIIKFDLKITNQLHPGLLKAGDLEYWEKVKTEYLGKYGHDEHLASVNIAKELRLDKRVVELVDCIGFNTGTANAQGMDFGKKICAYSDMRVGPKGVIALEERLADLRVRYDQKFRQMGSNERERADFENGLRQIERQIFERCSIKPEDITETAIALIKEELKSFEI